VKNESYNVTFFFLDYGFAKIIFHF
jgi:hypothetical protein